MYKNQCKLEYVDGFGNQLAKLENDKWESWDRLDNGFPLLAENLSLDNAGSLWIAHPFYIIKFDGTTFTTYNHDNSCLPSISLSGYIPISINPISEDQRWVGFLNNSGGGGGVVLMSGNECEFYTSSNSDFPDNAQAVFQVIQDPLQPEVFWIDTNGKIANFNTLSKEWTELNTSGSSPEGLAIDNKGTAWINISVSGIKYYQDDKWNRLNTHPGSYVNEIQITSDNHFWAATQSNGLAYLDLDLLQVVTSTEAIIENEDFSIYTTISSGKFHYNWKTTDANKLNSKLFIIDIAGRVVFQEQLQSGIHSFSLPENLSGNIFHIYTLRTKSGQIIKSGKIIQYNGR